MPETLDTCPARRCLLRYVPGLTLAGLLGPDQASAESFPARSIKLVCGFPPGAAADALLRALGDSLAEVCGQPVFVENRAGAAGAIAAATVSRAAPDGYTLAQVTNTTIRQAFIARSRFDPMRNLSFVIGVSTFEFGLIVDAASPWRDFEEFIRAAKARPGSISYGSIGIGSVPHQVLHQLGQQRGIQWTHVPYKGSAEAQLALRSGALQAVSDAVGLIPAVDVGTARLLAVYGHRRARRYPAAPTLRELGVDIAIDVPWGIAAPRGVPPARIRKLHDLLREAMQHATFARSLEAFGSDANHMDTIAYQRYMASRVPIERQVVEQFGLDR